MTPRTRRTFPGPRELAPLLRFKRLGPRPTERRLAGAHTTSDLRTIAQRRTPRADPSTTPTVVPTPS